MMHDGLVAATVASLAGRRFTYASEVELQEAIATALAEDGIEFSREHALRDAGRIDFLLQSDNESPCVGIEVKCGGSPAELFRQLMRYEEHGCIGSLIVFTDKRRLARAMPATLNSKPLHTICCAEAAL